MERTEPVTSGDRWPPSPYGVAAAAGGLLALIGVGTLLGDVGADARRAAVFAGGAVLLTAGLLVGRFLGGWRAAAAGVVLAAAGPVLLVGSLVVDLEALSLRQQIGLLAAATAAGEVALFLAGPVRRHVLLLGAALVAVWVAVLAGVMPAPRFPFELLGAAASGSVTAPGFQVTEPPMVEIPDFEVPEVQPPVFEPPKGFEPPEGFQPPEGFEGSFPPPSFGFEIEPPDVQFAPPDVGAPPSTEPAQPFDEEAFGMGTSGDATAAGLLSLLVALVYLAGVVSLDSSGRVAVGTPFAAAGSVAAVVAIVLLAGEMATLAAGLLAVVVGAALAGVATLSGVDRRFTGWLGALVAVGGVVAVVADLIDDAVPGGVALLVVGGLVAAGAAAAESQRPQEDQRPTTTV